MRGRGGTPRCMGRECLVLLMGLFLTENGKRIRGMDWELSPHPVAPATTVTGKTTKDTVPGA